MESKALNIDCMLGMSEYPDKYFELAIVDPPYGININHNIGRRKFDVKKHIAKQWDNEPPPPEYFKELFRVSKNQIIWGANNFEGLPISAGWIVWDKDISGDVEFSQCELAYQSLINTSKIFKIRAQSNENYSVKIHPTQKPVKLYKWLLDKYAKQGDKILDTHLGSGSSRIACYDYGFDFTGFELDKDYFEAQEKRFKDHISQTNLFKVA